MKKWQRTLVYFAVSYALLFMLQFILVSSGTLASWGRTPTFYLMPFAGFFLVFFGLKELEGILNIDFAKKSLGTLAIVGFIVLFLLAWHVALSFYFQNNFFLQLSQSPEYNAGQGITVSETCSLPAIGETGKQSRNIWLDSLGLGNCVTGTEFWGQLGQSTYLVFALSGLLGAAFSIVDRKKYPEK